MSTRREFVTGPTRREFRRHGHARFSAERFGKKMDCPVGVQLYTVRSLVDKDFPGTLAAIRKSAIAP